jgi:hypothetical protein
LAVSLNGGNRNDVTRLVPLIQAIPPVCGRRRKSPAVACSRQNQPICFISSRNDRRFLPFAVRADRMARSLVFVVPVVREQVDHCLADPADFPPGTVRSLDPAHAQLPGQRSFHLRATQSGGTASLLV